MSHEPHSVEEAVEAIEDLAEKQDKVRIGDVVDEFGRRSYGPFLLIFALLELTPLGGIPGVPSFLALMCALVAVQMLLAGDHIWLPNWIEQRSVGADKLNKSAHKLEGIAEKLDHWFHGRLKQFTSAPMQKVAAVMILLLCLTVPPLEFLPFASSAPMLAIAAFGLALTVRDGLLMLIATALSVAAIGFGTYYYWNSNGSGGGGFLGIF
ncbi:exopolysaccharide biosynthesis protein [Altererythrobacter arenosus]|uniref:Exopolysaccharide biosynthesis protein n=1 Tax=Altererythrobacter arenosus TaxID=3032592 RepID=A0ABY8FPF2_9SPHN|nr:exopolysaccharide biosynthesis protein [Altererythrobacter sp. CAU 1644]WFL75980.1 exopolysaccharide biosynthesis protein [Altererythrobacter sp. CAU 1644]